MKIEAIEYFKVIVPMVPDTVHSEGVDDPLCAPDPVSGRVANFWEFPKWIIRIRADNGLVGLGEPRRGDLEPLLQSSIDRLVGKAIFDLPIGNLPIPYDEVYDAFEMAWYDLIGKILQVPTWHLLGGKCTERVPVDYWMGRCTPEDTYRRATTAVRLGFQGVKMKCKFGDPIAERVRAVREANPDFSIVLDPNERFYNLDNAVEIATALDPYGPVLLEDPLPKNDLDCYSALKGLINHPIALHLSELPQLLGGLKANAAQHYNLLGTIREFVDWAKIAHTAGSKTWRGTGMDLGIRDMSSIHAAAAAGCELPCDIIGNVFREDDLIISPIEINNGYATIPDSPGLGVELDMNAVERYAA